MTQNKQYIVWLDLIRVVSIFFVVAIHVASPLYNDWKPPYVDWVIGNAYNAFARVSVPLLFMVSGYLLLSRQEPLSFFIVNRLRKVVVPLLAWGVIYLIWSNHWYSNYTLINAIKAVVYGILSKPAYYHLWFVNVLLAIYLLVPLLRAFVHMADEMMILYLALVWFIFGPLLDFVEQRVFHFNVPFDLGFFTEYFGYFYLGFVVGRIKFTRWVSSLAGLIYVLLAIYTLYLTVKLSMAQGRYNDFYLNYLRLNLAVMTVCAFIWLKSVGEFLETRLGEGGKKLLRHLSSVSLGIYLIHVMVLALLKWGVLGFRLTVYSASSWVIIPLLTLLVFLISWLITVVLQRIPGLRAIVPS